MPLDHESSRTPGLGADRLEQFSPDPFHGPFVSLDVSVQASETIVVVVLLTMTG